MKRSSVARRRIVLGVGVGIALAAVIWVLGTSEHATSPLEQIDRDRRWLIVLGNEEDGLRRLTLEKCDEVCSIPTRSGDLSSLNIAVAAGIVLHALSAPG